MSRAALVTGAAGGIGRAICERLLADGLDVLAVDLEAGATWPGTPFAADLSTREGNRAAVDAALEAFGRLDVIVPNAGIQHVAPVKEFPEDKLGRADRDHAHQPVPARPLRLGGARARRQRALHRDRLRPRARRLPVQVRLRRPPSTACSGW